MIRSIAHPTDLSPEGDAAFEHALRLAVQHRCPLDLLHVSDSDGRDSWQHFPHVREVLERWGLLRPGASVDDIHAATGVGVTKVNIRDGHAVDGLARFMESHPADLIVLRSHGRAGLERLARTSVSVELAGETSVPSLILGPAARPFVDSRSGDIDIGRVLVPVDHQPRPDGIFAVLASLLEGLGAEPDFLHVGEQAPDLPGTHAVRTIQGPVVDTLLEEAGNASLIVMATAGRSGLGDALRGSTTERVIREAPCPVLAVPVAAESVFVRAELPAPE